MQPIAGRTISSCTHSRAHMIVIAMTREIGSHGSDVAAGLVNELGLTIINSEIVASNVAGRLGVEEGTVKRYLEGSASIFERWQIDTRKLSRYTSEEILALAQQGNVLIRGWGAAALFRDIPQVISVRICTPMALRVRLMTDARYRGRRRNTPGDRAV